MHFRIVPQYNMVTASINNCKSPRPTEEEQNQMLNCCHPVEISCAVKQKQNYTDL